MVNVKGKWAFITGASRGIGFKLAHFMAAQGCNLILHSRKLGGTQKMEAELKASGIEVRHVEAELSDNQQVTDMLNDKIIGVRL